MQVSFIFPLFLTIQLLVEQDYYDQARRCLNHNQLDSARYYINRNLRKKPSADDYFLSALIHESQGAPLRALADYEAVIQRDANNIEAYFQKGLIYFETSSFSKAIQDFSYVIENKDRSETRAIYFGNDPHGVKGTFLTTLQSMKSRVYQYRGLAHKELGHYELALKDFESSFDYDTTAELFINRSQLHEKIGEEELAIADLKLAISLEPDNYLAWYNLALLDASARLPKELMDDESFSPMLSLMGANAYESKAFALSVHYYTKAIENKPKDDLSYIGRGKARLRSKAHKQARSDFIKALQINPKRAEAFYLIGNSFFYEESFHEALGFYEQYLSIDSFYANVWYNAAMSYLSLKEPTKACTYLRKAADLGMTEANSMLKKHCESQ